MQNIQTEVTLCRGCLKERLFKAEAAKGETVQSTG